MKPLIERFFANEELNTVFFTTTCLPIRISSMVCSLR